MHLFPFTNKHKYIKWILNMPIFRGKNFVSAVSDYKDSVRVVSRSNINLSASVLSIDGVELVDKDRVLLSAQTTQTQNGIYIWSTATSKLTRAEDADSIFELSPGTKVYVEEGTNNARTNWTLITSGIITPGVTNMVFAKESQVGTTDISGAYGSSTKTLQITVDETGEINSISEVDISVDGGEF
jgi:phage-related tail fiber protein